MFGISGRYFFTRLSVTAGRNSKFPENHPTMPELVPKKYTRLSICNFRFYHNPRTPAPLRPTGQKKNEPLRCVFLVLLLVTDMSKYTRLTEESFSALISCVIGPGRAASPFRLNFHARLAFWSPGLEVATFSNTWPSSLGTFFQVV